VKPRAALAWTLLVAAALAAAVFGTRLSDALLGDLHFEPGRRRSATLTAETRARLLDFEEEVRLTYHVTRREALPSHLSHLEEGVRDVFRAFRAATAGTDRPWKAEVVYPDDHPEWAEALASAGLAPWRARRIEGDGYRDDELWSSLSIGLGPRSAAVFNGLGPEQVTELQRLVLAQLEQLRQPRRPLVALAAPAEGYDELRTILETGAEVVEVDFDSAPELPDGTDLFVWLDPESASEAQLAAVERLTARGGSVLFAGHGLRSTEHWSGEELSVDFDWGPRASRTLLAHLGLVPLEGLLLDPRGAAVVGTPAAEGLEPPSAIAPWWVRATPDNQDFRTLSGQPNGSVVFRTPDAFVPDPLRLAELGLEATVLCSSSELASLAPVPAERIGVDAAYELEGRPQPFAALAAILRPTDPWTGRWAVLADSAPFSDAWLRHPDHAHLALLEIFLSNLTSDERMVAARIALEGSEVLPELAPSTRALLRLGVVFAVPALLGLVFLVRRRERKARRARSLVPPAAVATGLLALPVVLLVAGLAPSVGADLTRDGRNRLTDAEARTFEGLVTGPVRLELCFSSPERLPPEFKPLVRELRRTCEDLSRRLDDVEVVDLRPDDEDAAGRAELAAGGIAPLAVGTTQAEATRLFRPFAHLRLVEEDSGREVVLAFPSTRAFDELRFRLAHGLTQLARGAPTRVALFAEPPRLSPAEAALEYQRKGLFAPREGDAFSELAELLGEFGFDVERLDPRREAIPSQVDAVLWMQPRRNVLPMLEQLSGHLAAGGRALVAGQHFRIRSRQLEGADLEQRFWPEPQFLDLERHYLPELGLSVPREVIFDARHGSLELETRVDGGDGSTYTALETAQPFLCEAEGLPDGPVEGAFLLPFAARLAPDDEQLSSRGLRLSPWLEGSPRAWSYSWSGGDLPPEVLAGEEHEGLTQLAAPPLYGALIEGRFPAATLRSVEGQAGRRELVLQPVDAGGPEGRLLLMTDSELFKNDVLTLAEYEHVELARRAVAELALEPELVALLGRTRNAPPLGPQPDGTRLFWRLVVLGAFPALLGLLALGRRWVA